MNNAELLSTLALISSGVAGLPFFRSPHKEQPSTQHYKHTPKPTTQTNKQRHTQPHLSPHSPRISNISIRTQYTNLTMNKLKLQLILYLMPLLPIRGPAPYEVKVHLLLMDEATS